MIKAKETWTPTDDIVAGDVVAFVEPVFGGSYRKPKYLGERRNVVYVEKEGYGSDKQQHTFSVCVMASEGCQTLAAGSRTRRKGRNLYRQAERLEWHDESERGRIASEKHIRGGIARAARQARVVA